MLLKNLILLGILSASPTFASDARWFRSNAEFFAHQTQRQALATDPSSKINTDGKRFDVTIGNRIPLYAWDETAAGDGWSVGIDGGMLASLNQYRNEGKLTFATHTFDGFFGLYLGRSLGQWLLMLRTAHLSAHLVDNAPEVFTNTSLYNVFWTETVAGYFFRDPTKDQDWNFYAQGGLGAYTMASPRRDNPRASFGLTFNQRLAWDSPDLIISGDVLRAGIEDQLPSTALFVGFGRAAKLDATKRPYRAGMTFFGGSDYRNQYYARRTKFTAFTVQTEF
jgi:hypothetical protein